MEAEAMSEPALIHQRIDRIETEAASLRETVERMTIQLDPVLGPEGPQAGIEEAAIEPAPLNTSAVALRLHAAADSIYCSTDILRQLLERLEV